MPLIKRTQLFLLVLFSFGCTSEYSNTELNDIIIDDMETSLDENHGKFLNLDTNVLSEKTVAHNVEDTVANDLVLDVPKDTIDTYNFQEYLNLTKFLKSHVSIGGKVNYKGIVKNKDQLNSILQEFQSNYPVTKWTKNQKLSYWINAYNIFTIKLIIDNYPITSIKSINNKPWDKKFISLNGNVLSLNDIEHEIIRKQYNDPRVHFALNCASESCPILLNKAYRANVLSSQLTAQTKKFLMDSSKNDFSDSKRIKISQIFDWYKTDFTKNGTLIDFLNNYITEQLEEPVIEYLDYSWSLNQ